jgi:hydroxymethylpyrimidine kinase / phosphomethylpyrimidine kinase / thiamine-phosphate diphosphorylase
MPLVALTVGGSDSGGGAGIQADIKTFSALGLHGTSAITAITCQNTLGVKEVFGLEPEVVSAQMKAILEDFEVSYAKTGMLFSEEIVLSVAENVRAARVPLVIDPVIEAEAGGRLLKPSAVRALKEELLPLARVITPNIFEARALTGIEVKDIASSRMAAEELIRMGACAAVVKGGHLDCTDVLATSEGVYLISGQRVKGGNHGVGCTYSAALTSFLAMGQSLNEAASRAKKFAADSIIWSMKVGKGVPPVDQAGTLRDKAARCDI